jgi:hypothetical protein
LITLKFLASDLAFHGWKSPEVTWGQDLDCMADVLMGFYCNFWTFPTMKRELQGKKVQSNHWSAACFQEVGGAL